MNILLIGAPGSGKGSQAAKLIAKKNLKHLSTGELFRKNLKDNTELGQLAKSYIDQGKLVPDQVTNDMVNVFLQNIPLEKGVIFDGFPRNLPQAVALDQMLNETGRALDWVIFLEISDDQVVSRLSGRLWAPQSGCVYHIKNDPPRRAGFCDHSGEELITRSDDKEEVIRSRLKVFHDNSQTLLSYYKKRGLLKRLSAECPPEELFHRILQVLGGS